MSVLKVAMLQISPCRSLEKNLSKGMEYCKKAREMGADIALFPEMFSCGYDIYDRPPEVWTKDAISENSDFVKAFAVLSKQLGIAIAITFLSEGDNGPKNTAVLFDRNGKKLLSYSKVHTCDFGAEKYLDCGDGFEVCELDTEKGIVKVGFMICYDREFPESARILMLKGAEIALVPNACPMEINRLSQLRARAYENMMGIATCNYPETVPDCNGHSSAFDGVAYLPELTGSRDTCTAEAGGEECICIADFDLDMMREYRKKEVHGNAYRRPEQYGLLLDKEIKEPFLRDDKRRA